MTRGLLIGTLALMLSTPSQSSASEPADIYQWLEDVTGARPLAWVEERNAEAKTELTRTDQFQRLNERILAILDSDARIPDIQKLGPWYYNFSRDGRNPRGLWRRTTLDEYRKAKPAWEVVLDLDALAKEETVNWVWHGAASAQARLPAGPDLALARRRRRGRRSRVQPRRQVFRQGRVHTPRGEEPGELARAGQCVRRHRFRTGLDHHFGLSARCEGMAARHATRSGESGLRGQA